MNLVEILKFTEEYLKKYSFSKPRLEAEKLVSYVLNLDRIALYIHYERELSDDEKTSIKQYLKKMVEENKTFDELKGEKKDFKEEDKNKIREMLVLRAKKSNKRFFNFKK